MEGRGHIISLHPHSKEVCSLGDMKEFIKALKKIRDHELDRTVFYIGSLRDPMDSLLNSSLGIELVFCLNPNLIVLGLYCFQTL